MGADSFGSEARLTQKQVFKRQLRIVGLQMMSCRDARHVERFAHRVEVKANDARREPDRWNAPPLCESSHRRFTDLQNLGKLFRRQKFFALGHVWVSSLRFKVSSW